MAAIIQFLNKIGCDELRTRFIENGVTSLDIVYHLDHNLIKDLIPDLKTRIKFCVGLEKFKKDQTMEVQKVIENAVVVFDEPLPVPPLLPLTTSMKTENTYEPDMEFYEEPLVSSIADQQRQNLAAPSREPTREFQKTPMDPKRSPQITVNYDDESSNSEPDSPSAPKKSKRTLTKDFDLKSTLEADVIGSALLKIYENTKKPLDTRCQGYLCDFLVVHFLNRSPSGRLKNEDLSRIADGIVNVFQHECKETYFIPPVSKRDSYDNKSGIAKGKLVDKHRNKVAFIRHALYRSGDVEDSDDIRSPSGSENRGRKRRGNTKGVSAEADLSFDDEAKTSQAWLQFNSEPLEYVDFHWERSRNARRSLMKNYNIEENLNMWPILKGPLGPRLIDMDFDNLFPNKLKCMTDNWDTILTNLLHSEKNRLIGNDLNLYLKLKENTVNSNSRAYIQILLFNVVVAPKSKIRCADGKSIKSTINEAQNSMIDHFFTLEEKDAKIAEKRETMAKYGAPIQPFVLTQGPSIEKIEHVYVIAADACFLVSTVMKGLDLCFKMYHVLCSPYPPQSFHIWLLIQWCMFDIHLPYDKKVPYIISVCNKIRNK